MEAVEEAIQRYGTPEIMNTDQGSQFTSRAFVGMMKENEVRISMDGKNSWRDNVFVERLWRSVKYEDIYLRAYESVSAVRTGLNKYFSFYNSRRPHSSLDGQTPDQVYYNRLSHTEAA
jgi:putative transposase